MEEKSNKFYVIDASFILAYLLPDENIKNVQKIFDNYQERKIDLLSSALLPFEVTNAMYAATLSKRIGITLARELITEFLKLPILLEDINYEDVFDLSQKNKISVYDGSYLYLAQIKDLPLLTLDNRLEALVKNN